MVGEFPEDSSAHKNGELPSRANATFSFFLKNIYLFGCTRPLVAAPKIFDLCCSMQDIILQHVNS